MRPQGNDPLKLLHEDLRSILRSLQANDDHLQGQLRALAKAYNATVDDLLEIEQKINKLITQVGNP